MLLSQPVSQGDLVLGKATARAIGLCLVTPLFAIIGLVVAGAANWGRLWPGVKLGFIRSDPRRLGFVFGLPSRFW